MDSSIRKYVVRPKAARMNRDLRSFGRMSPIAVISIGDMVVQSPPSKEGGKNPSWSCVGYLQEQTLQYAFNPDLAEAVVTLYDAKVEAKKQIGSGRISLLSLQHVNSLKQWIPLYFRQKKIGDIQLEITLFGVQTQAAGIFSPFLAPPMGKAVSAQITIPVGVQVQSTGSGFIPPPQVVPGDPAAPPPTIAGLVPGVPAPPPQVYQPSGEQDAPAPYVYGGAFEPAEPSGYPAPPPYKGSGGYYKLDGQH